MPSDGNSKSTHIASLDYAIRLREVAAHFSPSNPPKNRVETLIGLIVNKLSLYSHKDIQKYKFAVVYEAEIMAGLAWISQVQ